MIECRGAARSRKVRPGWAVAALLLALASPGSGAAHEPESGSAWSTERFDRQIAPLLARYCLDCHQGADAEAGLDLSRRASALAGGESGPAVRPSSPDESLLWQRVSSGEMPPEVTVPEAERELLRQWIADGCPWGSEPIDRFRYSSERRAGYDWWSLQPIHRPAPPELPQGWTSQGAIDRFVGARLAEAGLTPSPQAERRVLFRRLNFDLTGLPPTPEAMSEFLADESAGAYARLVDRLLDSPGYGERWARHWLDVARFGESHGFEYDEPRRHAWPYRDWVIAAFQRDMPYDWFARLQIAGDVLAPDDPEAWIATGFLVAGPYDTPGQNQQSAAMKAVVRQDELEDLVSTVSQTFLGLTAQCARCHDHKFDPITQAEYYALSAGLSGVRQGEKELPPRGTTEQRRSQVASWKAERAGLLAAIEAIDEPVRARLRADAGGLTESPPPPLAQWDFSDALGGSPSARELTLVGSASLSARGLELDGSTGYAVSVPLERDLTEKTLHAEVMLAGLDQQGGAALGVQTLDGAEFDAIVFGEMQPRRWMAGSEFFRRTQSFQGPEETAGPDDAVAITLVYAADGSITAYRNGAHYGQPYVASATRPVTFRAGTSQMILGLRHSPAAPGKLLTGGLRRAAVYGQALSAGQVAALVDYLPEAAVVAALDRETAWQRAELIAAVKRVDQQLGSAERQMAYVCVARPSQPTRLLRRGDPRLAADEIAPAGIRAVSGPSADFGLPTDAPQESARRALAEWITSRENPLFARVIVNRLWHHHFGTGLVETPNDFGFNGGRPSHPELLDWLAAELVEHDYRLSHIHRLILLSHTYRQASLARPEALAIDRDNRLIWRYSPRRLEAEAVRDAMLAAAGRLNPQAGGPGFRDFQEINRSGTWSYLPADPVGPQFERRTVYRTWTRGGRGGLLDTLDCPDPSVPSPRRAVTTTPLQALALLNHSFVLRMCAALAERLEREAPPGSPRIERAFVLVYGREASSRELASATALVRQHGLPALARALLNSNEFLYVD